MRPKKHYKMATGKYYFTIKSTPNNITIYRNSKKAALLAYQQYEEVGKEIEWLGKWNGKKFEDQNPAALAS